MFAEQITRDSEVFLVCGEHRTLLESLVYSGLEQGHGAHNRFAETDWPWALKRKMPFLSYLSSGTGLMQLTGLDQERPRTTPKSIQECHILAP